MAILTKKEFATACGQTTNWLSVYIKRKKIELDGDLIDTSKKLNTDFLVKWQSKSGKEPAPVAPKAADAPKKSSSSRTQKADGNEELFDLSETSSDDALTRAKKFAEWQLKQVSIRLAELDEQKKRGELMPTDYVKSIFGTHSRSIVTSFKDAGELLLVKIVHKYQISLEDQALFKKELISVTNKAVDTSMRLSTIELDKLINEFSQTKEVGEHS